jgi:uncharacterized protein YjbI with pentapeptide repeats
MTETGNEQEAGPSGPRCGWKVVGKDWACEHPAWDGCSQGYCLYHSPDNGSEEAGAKEVWRLARELAASGDCDLRGWHFPVDPDALSFSDVTFQGQACFDHATFEGTSSFVTATFTGEAKFHRAVLGGADFMGAVFQESADFCRAKFDAGACFSYAKFQGTAFYESARFSAPVNFCGTRFEDRANFLLARFLAGGNFGEAYLAGADFSNASLQGVSFRFAAVDGETLIAPSLIDKDTDFLGVALENARVPPELKQLLDYSIRRGRWSEWYEQNPTLAVAVKRFWMLSDYGRSTGRILKWLFLCAMAFAAIYYAGGWICRAVDGDWSGGLVANLFVIQATGEAVHWWVVPFRAVYFSIVTMTTLGFGDLYASENSILGHMLLTVQVLIGYILLAALVTRFAVLFTAGGPSARFPDDTRPFQRLGALRNRIRDALKNVRTKRRDG